jgi:hypothetical protein
MVYFKPNIPIWVNFGGPWNGKCWYILWPFGINNNHLVYLRPFGSLEVNWYIFPCFGILFQEKSGNPGWKQGFFPMALSAGLPEAGVADCWQVNYRQLLRLHKEPA